MSNPFNRTLHHRVAVLAASLLLVVLCNSGRLVCQEVPWAQNPNNPTNVMANILAATDHYADRNRVQQPVGVTPPNSFSQPTPGQTQAFINQNPMLRNLDPMTQQSLVMGGQYGVPRTNVLNSPYINGQPNPFYENGHVVPNWYLPTTWTSNSMSWQGVQPNGFLPSGSATTHLSAFNSSPYNPTVSVPRYQLSQPTAPITNREVTRPINLNPTQTGMPGLAVTSNPMRSNVMVANLVSSRERALAVSATAGDKLGQAVNHLGLAQLLVEQGNFTQALAHIEAAEPMLVAAPDPGLRVDMLRTKSAAHMQSGEFEESLADNHAAMQILRTLDDENGQAENYLSCAWAFQSIGNIQRAILNYDSAFIVFSEVGNTEGQVRTRIGLGSLYQTLGQYGKAHAQYKAALQFASDSQKARIYASNADLLQEIGEPFRAVAHYGAAQQLLSPDSDPSLQIAVLTGMGRSLTALHAFQDAEKVFAQALGLVDKTRSTSAKAAVIASMGELQYWMAISSPLMDPSPHFKQALKNYELALPLMRATGDRSGEIGVLTNAGLVYDAKGKSKEALSYYKQALEKMEQLQTQARIEEFRGNIVEQSAALYARAIQLAVETHQPETAFALSEKARARLFLDQLGNARIDEIKQAPPDFLSHEDQLRKENITLERRLGQELSRPGTELNPESIAALQSRLTTVRTSYETLMNDLKLSNPDYASFLSVSPINLSDAQQHLDPFTTIVSFFTEPDDAFAFIVTKSGLRVKKLEVGQAELIHEISTFRDFAGANEVSPSLRILYKALIAPIRAELKTSRLIFVPHGVLHDLPFAALTSDGHRFLSDDFSISYLPSVSALSYMHSKPGSSSPRALVLVSNQEEGFPLLASADDEGKSVGSFFDSRLLLGEEATATVLRKEAANYDILHLVAHFEIDRKNPMASRILLSRGEGGEDSPLDLAGVYRLSLRKTDLVVLSGCQSQTGKRTRGDDIIGLSQAFLYAGSPSVVASLWNVDDDATKLLMIAFYSGLRQGLSKTDALRSAQTQVRRKYPSPFYWAGFVLNGDPGKLPEATVTVATN